MLKKLSNKRRKLVMNEIKQMQKHMYVNTFEFYKIEKYKKHLDFNLLHNKIKEELKEDFKTSCSDWDKYTWVDKIIEFFTANQRLYLLEVYNINIDVTFQQNVDEIDYLTMEFNIFLEELYNIKY